MNPTAREEVNMESDVVTVNAAADRQMVVRRTCTSYRRAQALWRFYWLQPTSCRRDLATRRLQALAHQTYHPIRAPANSLSSLPSRRRQRAQWSKGGFQALHASHVLCLKPDCFAVPCPSQSSGWWPRSLSCSLCWPCPRGLRARARSLTALPHGRALASDGRAIALALAFN